MNPLCKQHPCAPGQLPVRRTLITLACLLLLAAPSLAASADTPRTTSGQGTVIQAEGEARTKVANDLLTIELTYEQESALTAKLHEEMQQEAAKALDKGKASPEVRVRTTGYSVYPVYERGHIVRQHATYRLSLESKDFGAGLALAAALQPFQIGNLLFSVSPELGKATEKGLLQAAIADLRDNIAIAADTLGAKEIHITTLAIAPRQDHLSPRPQMMRAAMDMAEAAPSPVAAEAGESQVSISVSGTAEVE